MGDLNTTEDLINSLSKENKGIKNIAKHLDKVLKKKLINQSKVDNRFLKGFFVRGTEEDAHAADNAFAMLY